MQLSVNSGLHSGRKDRERYSVETGLDFIIDIGFKVIDINFSASIHKEPTRVDNALHGPDWRARMERLKASLDQRDVVVPYSHLPFFPFEDIDPATSFEHEMTLRAIEASGILGVKWAVVHPSALEDNGKAYERTKNYLQLLLETADKYGVGLAIENLAKPGHFCSDLDALCQLVDEFPGNVGICWDTGHCNLLQEEQAFGLRKIGDRLKVLHVHDNFGSKDEHSVPYAGTIDWDKVMTALKEIGFKGALNFEIRSVHLPESVRKAHAQYLFQLGQHLCSI